MDFFNLIAIYFQNQISFQNQLLQLITFLIHSLSTQIHAQNHLEVVNFLAVSVHMLEQSWAFNNQFIKLVSSLMSHEHEGGCNYVFNSSEEESFSVKSDAESCSVFAAIGVHQSFVSSMRQDEDIFANKASSLTKEQCDEEKAPSLTAMALGRQSANHCSHCGVLEKNLIEAAKQSKLSSQTEFQRSVFTVHRIEKEEVLFTLVIMTLNLFPVTFFLRMMLNLLEKMGVSFEVFVRDLSYTFPPANIRCPYLLRAWVLSRGYIPRIFSISLGLFF